MVRLFDKNKLVVTCDFDDNIVVVGGSIRGTVNIYVLEPVTLCGAALRYHVDESYLWHDRNDRPVVPPPSFSIEYVLFGHRSTRKAGPIAVGVGHYKYPFVIPVPAHCPPSSSFGGSRGGYADGALKKLKGSRVTVFVDHRVDVNVYIANSLMDKQATYTVPMVVKCTSPALLLSATNGREGHLRRGMSTTFSTRGTMVRAVFGGLFSAATTEQADCDLYVYNTSISLAETPFLHFAIRGSINCPFYVSLIRVTSYGQGVAFNRGTEEVVSRVMLPPLDAPTDGVKGRLVISPHALQSSTSFQGKHVACQFFLTLDLIYASGVDAGIDESNKMRIPIDVSHGSLAEEAVAGVVASTIVDGAVMAYVCPEGHAGEYVPVAPVTEGGVAPAAWGGSEMRYNRHLPANAEYAAANKPTAPQKAQPPLVPGSADAEAAAVHFSSYYGGNSQPHSNTNNHHANHNGNALFASPPDSVLARGLDGQQPRIVAPQPPYAPAAGGGAFAPPSSEYPSNVDYSTSLGDTSTTRGRTTAPDGSVWGGYLAASNNDEVVPSSVGPIYDESGRPIGRNSTVPSSAASSVPASAKTAAPLPPQ